MAIFWPLHAERAFKKNLGLRMSGARGESEGKWRGVTNEMAKEEPTLRPGGAWTEQRVSPESCPQAGRQRAAAGGSEHTGNGAAPAGGRWESPRRGALW